MENTITAQEIKRRGISAVDKALSRGPVHVITRNQPRYVIMSESDYQQLAGHRAASAQLWGKLFQPRQPGESSPKAIRERLARERGSWGR